MLNILNENPTIKDLKSKGIIDDQVILTSEKYLEDIKNPKEKELMLGKIIAFLKKGNVDRARLEINLLKEHQNILSSIGDNLQKEKLEERKKLDIRSWSKDLQGLATGIFGIKSTEKKYDKIDSDTRNYRKGVIHSLLSVLEIIDTLTDSEERNKLIKYFTENNLSTVVSDMVKGFVEGFNHEDPYEKGVATVNTIFTLLGVYSIGKGVIKVGTKGVSKTKTKLYTEPKQAKQYTRYNENIITKQGNGKSNLEISKGKVANTKGNIGKAENKIKDNQSEIDTNKINLTNKQKNLSYLNKRAQNKLFENMHLLIKENKILTNKSRDLNKELFNTTDAIKIAEIKNKIGEIKIEINNIKDSIKKAQADKNFNKYNFATYSKINNSQEVIRNNRELIKISKKDLAGQEKDLKKNEKIKKDYESIENHDKKFDIYKKQDEIKIIKDEIKKEELEVTKLKEDFKKETDKNEKIIIDKKIKDKEDNITNNKNDVLIKEKEIKNIEKDIRDTNEKDLEIKEALQKGFTSTRKQRKALKEVKAEYKEIRKVNNKADIKENEISIKENSEAIKKLEQDLNKPNITQQERSDILKDINKLNREKIDLLENRKTLKINKKELNKATKMELIGKLAKYGIIVSGGSIALGNFSENILTRETKQKIEEIEAKTSNIEEGKKLINKMLIAQEKLLKEEQEQIKRIDGINKLVEDNRDNINPTKIDINIFSNRIAIEKRNQLTQDFIKNNNEKIKQLKTILRSNPYNSNDQKQILEYLNDPIFENIIQLQKKLSMEEMDTFKGQDGILGDITLKSINDFILKDNEFQEAVKNLK